MTRRVLLMIPLAACCRAADAAQEVLDIAVRRGGVSYTADVMDALREAHPGRDLAVLIGADTIP